MEHFFHYVATNRDAIATSKSPNKLRTKQIHMTEVDDLLGIF